jgi:pre-mRNA-processing factor 19
MWDLTTQNVVATFEAHKNEINGLSFSENGVYFASSSFKDNVVNLWDLRKSQTFKKIELPENFEIRSLKFDQSGTFLGIVGSSTIIYNMKTWSILAEFNENTDIVTDIKFGKNCNYFATTSLDRNLKVFK